MSDMKYVRRAIEDTYIVNCDVVEYRKTRNEENKQNKYSEEVVLSNKKCRLSFETINNTNQTSTTNNAIQIVKLFIAPELNIKKGSKIIVTQNNRTTAYKNSSQPAIYETHQEIVLDLFEGWS